MKTLSTVFLAAFLSLFPLRAQTISTYAGGGPNDLPALEANLAQPVSVAFDSNGNIYVVASAQHRVFRIDPSGHLTVAAGNGTPGYSSAHEGVDATGASL